MKKKTILITLFSSIFILISSVIAFLIYDFHYEFNGIRTADENSFSLKFSSMNSSDNHELNLKQNDSLNIFFSINKGKANLIITYLENNSTLFKGKNITVGKFLLDIKDDGNYLLSVYAKHASGFINIMKNIGE